MSFKTVNLGDLHPLMCAAMNFVAGLRMCQHIAPDLAMLTFSQSIIMFAKFRPRPEMRPII